MRSQTELCLHSFTGVVPQTLVAQGMIKLCSPSSLLERASASFVMSVAWGVISLGDRWEGHIGICLGAGPHREDWGLHLCLADEFHRRNLPELAAWPKWPDSALAGRPVALEYFPG